MTAPVAQIPGTASILRPAAHAGAATGRSAQDNSPDFAALVAVLPDGESTKTAQTPAVPAPVLDETTPEAQKSAGGAPEETAEIKTSDFPEIFIG